MPILRPSLPLLFGLMGSFAAGCGTFAAAGYKGPPSDHFDGRVFHNERADASPSTHFLKWALHRRAGPWRRLPRRGKAESPTRNGVAVLALLPARRPLGPHTKRGGGRPSW